MTKDFNTVKPYTLVDCWGEKYLNEDGTVNKKSHYFVGVSKENKERILDAYFNQK